MSNATTPNMSCPSGGEFYACNGGSRFVGCCTSDPCGTNGCAAGALASTSFDPAQYGTAALPDQQCSAGSFYTCAYTDPPFWGCCGSSACTGGGCPAGGLAGAFLSNNPATAEPFLQLNETYEGSLTASPTPVPPTDPSSVPEPESSSNTGAIAGGVVGGIVVVAAIAFGLFWLLRRRKQRSGTGQRNVPSHDIQPEEGQSSPRQPLQTEMVEMEAGKYFCTCPVRAGWTVSLMIYSAAPKWAQSTPHSPHTPYLTPPPSYGFDERPAKHISYEMPAAESTVHEMDSGPSTTKK